MKRREFITLLGGAAAMGPLTVRAQQPGRRYRLGILHNQGPQSPMFPPFYDELRRLGFVEGQNLIVEARGYALRTEQFPAIASELGPRRSRRHPGWRNRRCSRGAGGKAHDPDPHPERRHGRARVGGVTGAPRWQHHWHQHSRD